MAESVANKKVLVIGAGIAGVWAALELADAGLDVHLVERRDYIGGQALQFGCKATDSCQKCNVCMALEKFRKVSRHPNISIYTASELTALEQESTSGRFKAFIQQQPLLIQPSKCIACGLCAPLCPADCITQATPALGATSYTIDRSRCLAVQGSDCHQCQDVCPTAAIDLSASSQSLTLSADAVLLATGYEPYSAVEQGTYGYGTIPNVITGLDAEIQLQNTATITKPSDSSPPKNIAFIQCVGSRNEETAPLAFSGQYCSAVCCAYAMRISRLLAQQLPESKITIFYMDLQRFGKDYETLYSDCRDKVRLVRSRPSRLQPAGDGDVLLSYEDVSKTKVAQEQFDLVVLSIGMRPAVGTRKLADMLDVGVDKHGFFEASGCHKPDVFVAGCCSGPGDIASTIERTSAATSKLLQSLRQTTIAL